MSRAHRGTVNALSVVLLVSMRGKVHFYAVLFKGCATPVDCSTCGVLMVALFVLICLHILVWYGSFTLKHYIQRALNSPLSKSKKVIWGTFHICGFMRVCVFVFVSRWWGLQGDGPDGAGVLLAKHEGSGNAARTAVSEPASALHWWKLALTPGTHHQRAGEVWVWWTH